MIPNYLILNLLVLYGMHTLYTLNNTILTIWFYFFLKITHYYSSICHEINQCKYVTCVLGTVDTKVIKTQTPVMSKLITYE